MGVLILCTGNICRSPMAEALLAREAADRGVEVEVASAGFVTRDRPAEPHAVAVMADRGIDLADHRSRVVNPEMLAEADLVIGMAREHVRRVGALDNEAFLRTFTLKELVRRGSAVGPAGAGLGAWTALIGRHRNPADLLGEDVGDDVADPMGRSRRRFRMCAEELEVGTVALADLVWPRGPRGETPIDAVGGADP